MELRLERRELNPDCIIGQLFIDGWFECFTLEDKPNKIKVDNKTCIPEGRYKIIINYSPHFRKNMMRLLDVPEFDGILIHAGNTAKDTSGCILVGKVRGYNMILESNTALYDLQEKVQAALDFKEEVWISVEGVK